jgi:hypothetical protein
MDNHWHWVGDAWWCGDDALGTYDDNYLDDLVIEDIYIDMPYLMLDHYIEAENGWDGGNVQISTDDGETWTLLTPLFGYDDSSIYGLDSPTTNAAGFTSSTGYAAIDYFDVSAYIGETVDIKFVFGSDSIISYYDGWFIYSVELGTMEQIVVPGTWVQQMYSGTGVWQWVPYSEYHYTDPPGSGSYYVIADSDDNPSDIYEVGIFSPSMDLTGETLVTLTYARDFQDFAGDGYMEVNTYSGGIFQETLFSKTTDDPYGGLVATHTFDPSGYPDPSDVQVEFLYSTEGDTYAWGFGLDDVEVSGSSGIIFQEDFEIDPFGSIGWVFTSVHDMTGEIVDPMPSGIVHVVGKMKANDLAYYRHAETALETMVILALNLEDGMEDDGSMEDCLGAYWSEDFQEAHNIGNSANAKGHGYGYWSHEGGYGYFLNPGKNGNGMAGFTGNEAVD